MNHNSSAMKNNLLSIMLRFNFPSWSPLSAYAVNSFIIKKHGIATRNISWLQCWLMIDVKDSRITPWKILCTTSNNFETEDYIKIRYGYIWCFFEPVIRRCRIFLLKCSMMIHMSKSVCVCVCVCVCACACVCATLWVSVGKKQMETLKFWVCVVGNSTVKPLLFVYERILKCDNKRPRGRFTWVKIVLLNWHFVPWKS